MNNALHVFLSDHVDQPPRSRGNLKNQNKAMFKEISYFIYIFSIVTNGIVNQI